MHKFTLFLVLQSSLTAPSYKMHCYPIVRYLDHWIAACTPQAGAQIYYTRGPLSGPSLSTPLASLRSGWNPNTSRWLGSGLYRTDEAISMFF